MLEKYLAGILNKEQHLSPLTEQEEQIVDSTHQIGVEGFEDLSREQIKR